MTAEELPDGEEEDDPAEDDVHEGSQDRQPPGLTPEQWEWIRRTITAMEPLTKGEHLWRTRTLRGAREGASDSAHAHAVVLLAQDFRLPEVLQHIEAGRIVIVVPAPQPPD